MAVRTSTINSYDTTEAPFENLNFVVEDKESVDPNQTPKKVNLHDIGIYQKPESGIPAEDLAEEVQQSLEKANNAQPKEDGMGLSENDYSDEEKQKVEENSQAKHTHPNKLLLDGITTYLKNATLSADEKTLTLTKQDGSTVEFKGGGGEVTFFIDRTDNKVKMKIVN